MPKMRAMPWSASLPSSPGLFLILLLPLLVTILPAYSSISSSLKPPSHDAPWKKFRQFDRQVIITSNGSNVQTAVTATTIGKGVFILCSAEGIYIGLPQKNVVVKYKWIFFLAVVLLRLCGLEATLTWANKIPYYLNLLIFEQIVCTLTTFLFQSLLLVRPEG